MLGHRVSAPRDRGHKENGFLQVWREVQEIHDLRDAGSGYVAHRSQLALRAHRPLPNQGIEPGDTGCCASSEGARLRPGTVNLAVVLIGTGPVARPVWLEGEVIRWVSPLA
jgi:hypothetical protein